jgi:hypothetical protein
VYNWRTVLSWKQNPEGYEGYLVYDSGGNCYAVCVKEDGCNIWGYWSFANQGGNVGDALRRYQHAKDNPGNRGYEMHADEGNVRKIRFIEVPPFKINR